MATTISSWQFVTPKRQGNPTLFINEQRNPFGDPVGIFFWRALLGRAVSLWVTQLSAYSPSFVCIRLTRVRHRPIRQALS